MMPGPRFHVFPPITEVTTEFLRTFPEPQERIPGPVLPDWVQIAALYGLTPRAVRYRCERLEQKIREARCADADRRDSGCGAAISDGDGASPGAATEPSP